MKDKPKEISDKEIDDILKSLEPRTKQRKKRREINKEKTRKDITNCMKKIYDLFDHYAYSDDETFDNNLFNILAKFYREVK